MICFKIQYDTVYFPCTKVICLGWFSLLNVSEWSRTALERFRLFVFGACALPSTSCEYIPKFPRFPCVLVMASASSFLLACPWPSQGDLSQGDLRGCTGHKHCCRRFSELRASPWAVHSLRCPRRNARAAGSPLCVQPRGEGRGQAIVRCRAWGCMLPARAPARTHSDVVPRKSGTESSPRQEEVCQGINWKQETVQPSMAQVLKAGFLALWKMLSLWKLLRSKNFVWSINSRTLMKSKIYFFAW